jgi:hypothetical protein
MSAKLTFLLAILSVLLDIGAVHGRECAGISFPEALRSEGVTLKLNGLGLREATMFKVDVYVAALYVTQTSRDAGAILNSNAPKELILHFVRDVERADVNKGWQEGFEKNAEGALAALKERMEAFKALMPDMKTGQRLRLVHKPGTGVQVDIDNAVKGTIKGDDFAKALFSIWLGSHPPNPGLTAGLLGGPCD